MFIQNIPWGDKKCRLSAKGVENTSAAAIVARLRLVDGKTSVFSLMM